SGPRASSRPSRSTTPRPNGGSTVSGRAFFSSRCHGPRFLATALFRLAAPAGGGRRARHRGRLLARDPLGDGRVPRPRTDPSVAPPPGHGDGGAHLAAPPGSSLAPGRRLARARAVRRCLRLRAAGPLDGLQPRDPAGLRAGSGRLTAGGVRRALV